MTAKAERRTSKDSDDSQLTPTYVRVLLLEAAIVAALWVFGRMFS